MHYTTFKTEFRNTFNDFDVMSGHRKQAPFLSTSTSAKNS